MNIVDSTDPISVAMIGGGINSAIGQVHVIAMQMDRCFSLIAGCFSRDNDVNRRSAIKYDVDPVRVYKTPKDLLEAERGIINTVVVASPIQSHYEHITMALALGFNVISDKPLVSNLAEFEALSTQLKVTGRKVFCIFNYNGYPAVREIQAQIAAGAIGRTFKVMVEMPQDSYMRLKNFGQQSSIQAWRLIDAEIPCITLDLLTHLHALVDFTCQKEAVSALSCVRSISNVSPGLIDEVDIIARYQDDLVVNFWYGKVALGYRNGLRLRVFGTEGSFEWHQEDPEKLKYSNKYGDLSYIDRLSSVSLEMSSARYQRFKAGHPAGFIEAFANYYQDIYFEQKNGENIKTLLQLNAVERGLRFAHLVHGNVFKG